MQAKPRQTSEFAALIQAIQRTRLEMVSDIDQEQCVCEARIGVFPDNRLSYTCGQPPPPAIQRKSIRWTSKFELG